MTMLATSGKRVDDVMLATSRIQRLQARMEKAENELKKANLFETHSAIKVNPIVTEQVNR